MIVLSASDIGISFGGETLFDGVSFALDEKGRAGLVGVNGCGKTTLFNIITGRLEAESGGVSKQSGLKIGCMEQFVIRDDSVTLYDEVLEIFRPLMDMETELSELSLRIDSGGHDEGTLARQMYLRERYEAAGGLYYRSRTGSALTGLGFDKEQFDKPVRALSGGQKSKAQLAKLLLSESDILLLDEPTNHLDIAACEWLEKFLSEFGGAYIIISHDRYFLDKVTQTTYELENGRLTEYKGDYTRYLELKEEARKAQQRVYEQTEKEIRRIEGIIAQQKSFGRERNFITAESKQKQVDRLKATLNKPSDLPDSISFSFKCREGGANDVLTAKNLSKSFDGETVFSEVNLDIKKGTSTVIMGENGCGKTTLLKILTGRCIQDSGKYKIGNNIQIGYYDQAQSELNPAKTVIDEVWDSYPHMTETEVRTALARFLFKGDEVYKTVGNLSGGEKARVALLKLMLGKANLLLLDEPTNHLDINSREALENALLGYGGTLIIVSHDRYLINKLADNIVCIEKSGSVGIVGGYDEYLAYKESMNAHEEALPSEKKKSGGDEYKERKERESRLRRLKGEASRLEARISETEQRIAGLSERLCSPDIASDYEKAAEISLEIDRLKGEEEELTAKWLQACEEIETIT